MEPSGPFSAQPPPAAPDPSGVPPGIPPEFQKDVQQRLAFMAQALAGPLAHLIAKSFTETVVVSRRHPRDTDKEPETEGAEVQERTCMIRLLAELNDNLVDLVVIMQEMLEMAGGQAGESEEVEEEEPPPRKKKGR